jgi:diaminohydroxyphosphoribosylaminopyrimidine deaminase/5-amino-6-(5-phosphoribosylamino)uracil reductase
MTKASDHFYMMRALRLAHQGLYTAHPNPRVGCVIVKNHQIAGEGFHARTGSPHAEVNALAAAGGAAEGATVYVTLEPCCHQGHTPPCTQALISAHVGRVVVAMEDPNPRVAGKGLNALREAGIGVDCGVLENTASGLNPGFICRMRRGRPWIRIKSAISLDGRTAMASGESQWITGEAARRDVQFLRAQSSAVMTGRATVVTDDPSMNVRLSAEDLGIDGEVRQPLRVILDSKLQCPPEAKMFKLPGASLIITAVEDLEKIQRLEEVGVEVECVEGGQRGVSLPAVMQTLAKREINEVHVEAGAVLTGALIEQALVDELILYMAPHLMGDRARGLVHLPHVHHMAERVTVRIYDMRRIGEDLRLTAALVPVRLRVNPLQKQIVNEKTFLNAKDK